MRWISGLDETSCMQELEQVGSLGKGLQWIPSSRALERLAAGDTASGDHLTWLYRSPADVVARSVVLGLPGVEAALREWTDINSRAIGLWRRDGSSICLVRARDAGPDPRGTASAMRGDDALREAILSLLSRACPEEVELYELLEASAWLPEGQEPDFSSGDHRPTLAGVFALIETIEMTSTLRGAVAGLEESLSRREVELAEAKREAMAFRNEGNSILVQLERSQHMLRQQIERSVSAEDRSNELQLRQQTAIQNLQTRIDLLQGALRREAQRQASLTQRSLFARAAAGVRNRLRRSTARSPECVGEVRDSRWFDAHWYLETYPDVREAGVDPALHYCESGWMEGRNPGPAFDTYDYLREHPDVAEAGINPLWHYITQEEQVRLSVPSTTERHLPGEGPSV